MKAAIAFGVAIMAAVIGVTFCIGIGLIDVQHALPTSIALIAAFTLGLGAVALASEWDA